MDLIVHITSEEQFNKLFSSATTPLVLFFCGTNCGPCRQLCPKIEDKAINSNGKFVFVKINVDTFRGLASQYGYETSIPCVVLFKNGKILNSFEGCNLEAMEKMLALC